MAAEQTKERIISIMNRYQQRNLEEFYERNTNPALVPYARMFAKSPDLFEAANISPTNILSYPKEVQRMPGILENFKKLEALAGTSLVCTKYIPEYDRFPRRFYNAAMYPERWTYHTVDGIVPFPNDRNHIHNSIAREKYIAHAVKNAFWREETADIADHWAYLGSKDRSIRLYAVSPYFPVRYNTSPVFLEAIKQWVESLIALYSPEYLRMYSVRVLPPDQTIYYPGHTITIILGTHTTDKAKRKAFDYTDQINERSTFYMGVTLRSPKSSMDIPYYSMFRLRRDIAFMLSKEIGDHYADILNHQSPDDDAYYDKASKLAAEYINSHHPSPRKIFDFLYAPDCAGRLSPGGCKALITLLTGDKPSHDQFIRTTYGYAGWEHPDKGSDFIRLLYECVEAKKALVWD